MRTRAVDWLAIVMVSVPCQVAMADSEAGLAGTWLLDDRSSDDPVRELLGRQGDGLGSRIVRSVNVFGIPVGSLPFPDGEDDDEPLTPEQVVGALAYVFEATYRLRVSQDDATTEIRYGNAPTIGYRAPETLQRNGWTSKVDWRDGELTIEHERAADGAHISERYWVEARAGELHWTVRLKRAKSRAVDVERVFYRAPGVQDTGVPLTARLSP
jgi:hypothetical protein